MDPKKTALKALRNSRCRGKVGARVQRGSENGKGILIPDKRGGKKTKGPLVSKNTFSSKVSKLKQRKRGGSLGGRFFLPSVQLSNDTK